MDAMDADTSLAESSILYGYVDEHDMSSSVQCNASGELHSDVIDDVEYTRHYSASTHMSCFCRDFHVEFCWKFTAPSGRRRWHVRVSKHHIKSRFKYNLNSLTILSMDNGQYNFSRRLRLCRRRVDR